jgi:hypothetical protein
MLQAEKKHNTKDIVKYYDICTAAYCDVPEL